MKNFVIPIKYVVIFVIVVTGIVIFFIVAGSNTAILYSVGTPAELKLSQYEQDYNLRVETNPTDFTISGNCRYILSTLDGEDPWMIITDLGNEGYISSVHMAAVYMFGDDAEEVYHLMNPTFSPNNVTFSIVGLMPGSRYALFMYDPQLGGKLVYQWIDATVVDIKWANETTVVIATTDGLHRPITYTQASLSSDSKEVFEEVFSPLPSSENEMENNLPTGAHKALTCSPAYKITAHLN